MSLPVAVFFVLSALILGSGFMVVLTKNIIHSALWLIASFLGVAALYLLMEAEFLAVVQILVYAGAVSILVLFAIMLTRQVTGEGERVYYERWWVPMLVSLALFALILVPAYVNHDDAWNQATDAAQVVLAPPPAAEGSTEPAAPAAQIANTVSIGESFMREYLLPFEVASILLLMALIGSIVIAYEERTRRRRVLTLAEELALKKRGIKEPRDAEGAVVPDVSVVNREYD